jgi:5-methylcytosine-specific restriction endonuclease McrA
MPQRVPMYRPPGASLQSSRPRNSERDRDSKRFYDSSAWVRLRRMHLARSPLCVKCQAAGRLVPATHVHHVVEVLDDPSKRLDEGNLESLCHSCHSTVHASTPGTCMPPQSV